MLASGRYTLYTVGTAGRLVGWGRWGVFDRGPKRQFAGLGRASILSLGREGLPGAVRGAKTRQGAVRGRREGWCSPASL